MLNRKGLILFILFCFPAWIYAQAVSTDDMDITGLWKGSLFNDSTNQQYKYEIGISEEKGKLTGFSHTWYNDKDYFVVKKLKVKRIDHKIIIEDVDIIAYNYPESPPRGVHRLHVLTLTVKDSVLSLSGPFSTNRTKVYAAATGTVHLERKNDYWKQSDLMAHLQELGLDNKLSFVAKDRALEKAEEDKVLNGTQAAVENKAIAVAARAEPSVKAPRSKQVPIAPIAGSVVKSDKAVSKLPTEKVVVAVKNEAPAADVLNRKNVLQETVYFKTDSLQLSLYDNGEVDGDTVSVLMNGDIIMAKQGLSTNAIRKTINIPAGMDSISLVMYAENLGTLPPNSGLLVVRDGKETYEIRFSGDLQRNAAIILKRKK